MSFLENYFHSNTKRMLHKWYHYFAIYERHFERFRNTSFTLVEIGVGDGGSLQMWKEYFGKGVRIIGVDINPHCKEVEEEQIEIIIGDQSNRTFLKTLAQKVGTIDILIDDGGHKAEQQIPTFEELFPFISNEGLYLCEDLHASYWKPFGGAYKGNTFIEYTKNLIDAIHAWYSDDKNTFDVTELTKTIYSLHYYDSILVIEKTLKSQPDCGSTGKITVKYDN